MPLALRLTFNNQRKCSSREILKPRNISVTHIRASALDSAFHNKRKPKVFSPHELQPFIQISSESKGRREALQYGLVLALYKLEALPGDRLPSSYALAKLLKISNRPVLEVYRWLDEKFFIRKLSEGGAEILLPAKSIVSHDSPVLRTLPININELIQLLSFTPSEKYRIQSDLTRRFERVIDGVPQYAGRQLPAALEIAKALGVHAHTVESVYANLGKTSRVEKRANLFFVKGPGEKRTPRRLSPDYLDEILCNRRNLKTANEIFRSLSNAIQSGRLLNGDTLPSRRELSKHWQTSEKQIRLATQRLKEQGWIVAVGRSLQVQRLGFN